MKHLYSLITLVILHGVVDQVYVYLYPTVNPVRASMIGASSLVILSILYSVLKKRMFIHPVTGGLSIFSSALFGALLVQASVIVSKSALSALAHVGILIFTYGVCEFIRKRSTKIL